PCGFERQRRSRMEHSAIRGSCRWRDRPRIPCSLVIGRRFVPTRWLHAVYLSNALQLVSPSANDPSPTSPPKETHPMSLTVRRVVTGYDNSGRAKVLIDETAKNVVQGRPGAHAAVIWTTEGFPVSNDGDADASGR